MNGWMDGHVGTDRWTDGRTDGGMDEWTDGQTDISQLTLVDEATDKKKASYRSALWQILTSV